MPDHIPKLLTEARRDGTSSFVVLYDWGCLVVIALQSFLERLSVIVTALNKRLAGDVVFHWNFGRMVGKMVGTSRRGMD